MATIQPTTQPARWIIEPLAIDGQTAVGQLTGVNPAFDASLIWAEGDTEFLVAAQGKVTDYNPIPNVGEWCEAGMIYGCNGGLVICRQDHFRTIYPPEETLALWMVYREDAGILEWIANEPVSVGDLRTYNELTYECIQSHVTQEDWTPVATLNVLWKLYQEPTTIAAWVQPTGAHDAYLLGAQVTHNGHLWESLYAANVWEPGVFGWQDLGVYP